MRVIIYPLITVAAVWSIAWAPSKPPVVNRIAPTNPALVPSHPEYIAEARPVVVQPPKPSYRVVRVKVTACSPEDPIDLAYYRKNGYEGRLSNAVAAYTKHFPKGTKLSIPGYAGGALVPVDSAGGSIIRRSARRGVIQIDVKFRTYKEARTWGTQWLDVKVYDNRNTR